MGWTYPLRRLQTQRFTNTAPAPSADNVVRLFYLNRGQTVQEFQEFATLLRTIGDIRRVFTTNESKILVQVFYVGNAATVKEFSSTRTGLRSEEAATLIRTIAEVRRVFPTTRRERWPCVELRTGRIGRVAVRSGR